MAFRDQMLADLSAVFLPIAGGHAAEFDGVHSLDGQYDVACILDETAGISIEGAARTAEAPGVATVQTTLYVRAEDYAAPVVDQRITIDGRPANVIAVATVEGLHAIRLRWWDS